MKGKKKIEIPLKALERAYSKNPETDANTDKYMLRRRCVFFFCCCFSLLLFAFLLFWAT